MLSVHHTNYSGSRGFLKILREHIQRCGIPLELSRDGASIYMSQKTQDFLKRYGIRHRVSSVGNPHNDAITQAMLAYSNTPCKILGKSPAQLAFGRRLKDLLPRSLESLVAVPADLVMKQLEIRKKAGERLDLFTKTLPPLKMGDFVQVQNLVGHNPLKSDRAGIIVQDNGNSSYNVKIIGSCTITLRNRSNLRRIDPNSVPGYFDSMEKLFPTQARGEGTFHDLTHDRAGSQGTAAPLPGSPARGVERGSTLKDTFGPASRLVDSNGSLKEV